MFVTDGSNDADKKDVNEYDLTCGFGVVDCIDPTANKDDVASIETQSETTKTYTAYNLSSTQSYGMVKKK